MCIAWTLLSGCVRVWLERLLFFFYSRFLFQREWKCKIWDCYEYGDRRQMFLRLPKGMQIQCVKRIYPKIDHVKSDNTKCVRPVTEEEANTAPLLLPNSAHFGFLHLRTVCINVPQLFMSIACLLISAVALKTRAQTPTKKFRVHRQQQASTLTQAVAHSPQLWLLQFSSTFTQRWNSNSVPPPPPPPNEQYECKFPNTIFIAFWRREIKAP